MGIGKGVIPGGTTRFFTMIGTPVVQVKSPPSYNRYFAAHGIDAVMVALDVPADQVAAHFGFLRRVANYGGSIVTVPHKEAAPASMDELSPRAAALGAVNVVRAEAGRLVGDMVDGLGFLLAAKARGLAVRDARAVLLGGGGAGAAIALALAEAGAAELVVGEPRTERRRLLERVLKAANPALRLSFDVTTLAGFDLAVNATPVGMNDDPNVPFPTDTLAPPTLVADIVTNPRLTPWLAAAIARGCLVQYGAEMAHGQFGWMGRHLGFDIPDPEEVSGMGEDGTPGAT